MRSERSQFLHKVLLRLHDDDLDKLEHGDRVIFVLLWLTMAALGLGLVGAAIARYFGWI